jgi:3D (Asp-Asp-Asp) domain-containing protein
MKLRAIILLGCLSLLALVPAAAWAETPPVVNPDGSYTLDAVQLTEYYPVSERGFKGRKVRAPGIPGLHPIDWLYSARGIAMEGDGITLTGQRYHMSRIGTSGWVNKAGRKTTPTDTGWTNGRPFWRGGGFWRNAKRILTIALQSGRWTNGRGVRYIAPTGIRFAYGPSKPLTPNQSIAVDPAVIELGSTVYIPAYKNAPNGGWFIAEDVGGAIIGRHIDVYRLPPTEGQKPQSFSDQSVTVYPPGGGCSC